MVNQRSAYTTSRRIGRYEEAFERQFRWHQMFASHANMANDLVATHRHPGSCHLWRRQPGGRIVGPSDGIALFDMHLSEHRGAGFEIKNSSLPDHVSHGFM